MKTQHQITRTRWRKFILIFALAIAMVLPTVKAAPGDLDTSFNPPNGFNTLTDAQFTDVAIQPDGRILAVGQIEDTIKPGDVAVYLIVARFNTDGTLDASFGSSGVATAESESTGLGLALQADGKIVAAGHDLLGDFFVTRFNANGTIDTSFGQSGSTKIDFDGGADVGSCVALAPGGSIVVAGWQFTAGFELNVTVARLLSNGSLDSTFGTGGKIATEPGIASDVAVLSDGRILVVDSVPPDFLLLRYNANGTLDTTFGGGDGIAVADFSGGSDTAAALAVLPDARIVVVGNTEQTPGQFSEALARFNSSGNLDTSFDGDGKAIGALTFSEMSGAAGVTLQSDGDIVTAGVARFAPSGSDGRALVSRYLSNGSPDSSFGNAGTVITDFPGDYAGYSGVAIQSDGKIVAAGIASDGDSGLVARYNGDTAPPPPPPVFDICLQNENDNGGRLIFRFNSTTGAYEFRDCPKGLVLTGTGTITVNSCKLELTDLGPVKPSDRNVSVQVNPCTKKATVSISIKSPAKMYSFMDNDITQGSCVCP